MQFCLLQTVISETRIVLLFPSLPRYIHPNTRLSCSFSMITRQYRVQYTKYLIGKLDNAQQSNHRHCANREYTILRNYATPHFLLNPLIT